MQYQPYILKVYLGSTPFKVFHYSSWLMVVLPNMTSHYQNIQPSGGDTGVPLNINRRLHWIKQHIDLRGKWILDCGCGSGAYVLKFFEFSPYVFGVEYNADKVRAFRSLKIYPEHVSQGTIEKLDFEEGQFDFVLLNEVLEHVSDEVQALDEIYRVLKPSRTLVLFSPNRLYPFETHGCSLKRFGILVPHFFPFIPYIPVGFGNKILNYNARNYFPWELKRKIKQHGFKIQRHTYIWQTFENISGNSPRLLVFMSPFLRRVSFTLEKIPLVNAFGVS
jgi:SAM-dependent methyltransferase